MSEKSVWLYDDLAAAEAQRDFFMEQDPKPSEVTISKVDHFDFSSLSQSGGAKLADGWLNVHVLTVRWD